MVEEAVAGNRVLLSDPWLQANGLLRTRRANLAVAIPCLHDKTVHALGLELLKELENGCPSGVLYAEGICLALLGRVDSLVVAKSASQASSTRKLSATAARRVTDFIESNLDQDLSMSAIASAAGMGERNLSVCFRSSFGMTVHRYVSNRRLDMAAGLLRSRDWSLAEIAATCGYSSQSHFTTAFHLANGLTPARFRSRVLVAT